MRVPLTATFVPQIVICIVLGAVSIALFNSMHHDAITGSMRNSLDGSMTYVEERIAGPFTVLRSHAALLAANIERNNATGYRGDGVPIQDPTDPAVQETLRNSMLEMRALTVQTNFTYPFILQGYRGPRKPNASATSTSPSDFDWGWSGVSQSYNFHYINSNDVYIWNFDQPYPTYDTSDMFAIVEPTETNEITGRARYLHRDNATDGNFFVLTTWVDVVGAVAGRLNVLYEYGLPMSFDPVTGFVTNMMAIDMECTWIGDYVRNFGIPATELTVVLPSENLIMASSFATLEPGYNRPNLSDVNTFGLWTLDNQPDVRLAAAIREIRALGFPLDALPAATQIIEPAGSDDIISVRPVRKGGLNLLAIGVTERDYYFSDGQKTARNAIITCAVLIVAACAVAVVTAVLLGRPLDDLRVRMALTASLVEDETPLQPSMVAQIADMQTSYVMMKRELTRMKSFLPQSLLMTQDDNAEEDEGDISATGSSHDIQRSRDTQSDGKSDRVSRSSRRTSNSSGNGVAVKQLNMVRTVVAKRVVIGMFNLSGYHREVANGGGGRAAAIQTAYLRIVSEAVSAQRGVVESFHGDRVVATWNAVTNVASAARRGVQAAFDASRAMKQQQTGSSAIPCALTAAFSEGQAFVGNMGTDSMMRFNVIGTAYSQASILERTASKMVTDKGCILMTQSMASDVELAFYVRCVDIRKLPGTSARGLIVLKVERPRDAAADDEWMYELQESETGDPCAAINAAYRALHDDDEASLSAALAKLSPADQAELESVRARRQAKEEL